MRGKSRFRSIRGRVFLYTVSVLIVLMGLVIIVTNFIVDGYLKDIAIEKYLSSGTVLENDIAARFEAVEKQTENFIYNEYIQRSLEPEPMSIIEEVQVSQIWTRFSSLAVKNGVYIDFDGNIYQKQNRPNSTSMFNKENFVESGMVDYLGKSYARSQWIYETDTVFGSGEPSLFLVRNVRNMGTPTRKGVLVLRIENSYISKAFNNVNASPNLLYMLLDPDRNVYYAQYQNDFEQDTQKNAEIVSKLPTSLQEGSVIELPKQILFVYDKNLYGMTLVVSVPNTVIYQVATDIQRNFILASLPLTVFAILMSILYAHNFTRPIRKISMAMGHFDGNCASSQLEIHTNTELDAISSAYNSMVERIAKLLQDVSAKEKELKEQELDSLLYQINPHFLYNTLDNVYMMARVEGCRSIMDITQSLSAMLRISLNKGGDIVSVEKEMNHVSAYMEIQKIRYEGLFAYTIDCQPDVAQCSVMKLVLQPIVENSIKYGFAKITEGGHISIGACKQDAYILFTIENNGESIYSKKAEEINGICRLDANAMRNTLFSETGGFGIYNIVSRLRIKYDDNFELKYTILDSGGTRCTLKMPIEG
ncbi:histidine kinase [Lachnospiraceae bacterium ZAX-1]